MNPGSIASEADGVHAPDLDRGDAASLPDASPDKSPAAAVSEDSEKITLCRQGVASFRRREFEDAARRFAAWAKASPEDGVPILCLARAQALEGKLTDALSSCEKALELDPTPLRSHLLLARLAHRTHNGPLRVAAIKGAVRLRPDAVALRVTLVRLMLRRANVKQATAVAQEALALAPGDRSTQLSMARCHIALGQLAKAQAILATLHAANAEDAELASVRQEMDARRGGETGPASKRRAADGSGAADGRSRTVVRTSTETPDEDATGTGVEAASPRHQSGRNIAYLPKRVGGSPPADGNSGPTIPVSTLLDLERRRPRRSLIDHILIIRSLILRELRLRHGANGLGFLTELLRPALVVIAHYWMFYLLKRPMPAAIPIEAFVLGGFATWFAFSTAWSGAATGSRWPAGATALPNISDLDLRIAKASWNVLLNLVFCLAALIPLRIYGRDLPLPNVPDTCLTFGLAGVLGFGVGLTLERLSQLLSFVKTAEKLLTWVLFISAGLYFCLQASSELVARWFWYNPVIHLVEFERHAFDPGYPVALIDLRYPAVVAFALLVTGLLSYAAVRPEAPE